MSQQNRPVVRKHVDHYIVFEEKLGQGQFSVQQPQQKEVLQKEIDILLKAKHQNLIRLHDMKQSPNNVYLILDYCNGGDLKSYIQKKGGKLSEQQAVQFFKELCAGYKVLHEQQIIHRDLKPENIMLHDDHVKIGDFGFARFVNGNINDEVRMSIKCSPLYAPPQLLKNQEYSSKCDVFSLGVVFFEMLYGTTPFNGQTIQGLAEDIRIKIKENQFQFPAGQVSEIVKDIIVKMLQYDEGNRVSWEGVFKHPIQSYTPLGFLEFGNNESIVNPMGKSIERARISAQENILKIIQEEQEKNQQKNDEDDMEEEQQQMDQSNSNSNTGTYSYNNDQNALYAHQMEQIEKKNREQNILKKIDKYIHFSKNKALFTNTALISFWNSFQKDDRIRPHIKCMALVCLSGYHYFFLVTLQNMLLQEGSQKLFKQDTFNAYKQSQMCRNTQEQLVEIVKNAETLYNDLYPLCMKEFQNSLQNQNNSEQDKKQVQIFVQTINKNQLTYDTFLKLFPQLIPEIFSSFDLQNTDKKALQSLLMLLIFMRMDKHFPPKKYEEFDFQLFEENFLINVNEQQILSSIKSVLQDLGYKINQ
ncbi:Protein kinase-like domain [Pseudocohnilembus persalinus]|uniref:Protein kinase-like domain n=1 Tax=Pseudocohnilembus persalinus TaxID=266149 RepID=A0A0V0Q7I4_PSEPJ|nr:Protein kinase-like domain [Pseudocohnilembus persalinus]|eukprot:KRW98127.1 Protein kinase-like domain [Pseudocohnilembus persalinus]